MNSINKVFVKDRLISLFFSFFLKASTIFQAPFLSINQHQNSTSLILSLNSFDRFLLRKISQRYLERLFILDAVIKAIKLRSLILLDNITTFNTHDISILL